MTNAHTTQEQGDEAIIETMRALGAGFAGWTTQTPDIAHVYNALIYAWPAHEQYLRRFLVDRPAGRVLFTGINPGPWGMAQTGVPFGDIEAVKRWMGLDAPVHQPANPAPERPVLGFASTRREVSGSRLWGWAEARFGEADAFFDWGFVWNYCPLMFLHQKNARNITPDRLCKADRDTIFAACDEALRQLVRYTRPARIIGVGGFMQKRASAALAPLIKQGELPPVERILHPSPASPAANRGWAEQAEAQLSAMGLLPS